MRALFALLSPAGARARLPILIFHRVHAEPDPLFPDDPCVARFDQICRWVARWHQVLPLAQGLRQLADGSLPARALAITFDDGYADNHDLAAPILRRHGLSATFFIATGFLDGGIMWNDIVVETLRRARAERLDAGACGIPGLQQLALGDMAARRQAMHAVLDAVKYLPLAERLDCVQQLARQAAVSLPADLMMASHQVPAMRQLGMDIGGHTVSHPILAKLAATEARDEIVRGKRRLEDLLQQRVALFAYPNGRPGRDYDAQTVALVREAGFDAAVTTSPGAAGQGADPFQIPRFTPWERSGWRFALRQASNLRNTGQTVQRN